MQLRKIEKLRLPEYKPGGDPVEHMTAFNIAMARDRLSDEERDAGYCQLFVETLHEKALTWFSQLEENSIGSFCDLSAAFLKTFDGPVNDLSDTIKLHGYQFTTATKDVVTYGLINPLQSLLTSSPWWLVIGAVVAFTLLMSSARAAAT